MIDQYVDKGYETTLKVTSGRQMLLITEGKCHAPTMRACLPWQERLQKISVIKRILTWFKENKSFLVQIGSFILNLYRSFHPQ